MTLKRDLDEYLQKRRAKYGYRLKLKKKPNASIDEIKTKIINTGKKIGESIAKLKESVSNIFRKEEVVELNPEELEETIEEQPEEVIEEEIEDNIQEEPKKEPKRFKIFEKIKEIIKGKEKVEIEETIEEVIEFDYEELRQAFRIANAYLKKLPPGVLKAFKHSEDYKIYYRVMEKLDLVKKKQEDIEKEESKKKEKE